MRVSKGARVLILVMSLALALLALSGTAAAQPLSQKPIPHELAGREACLACHAPTGVKPVPATHAGRTNETCQACHKLATAPGAPTVPAGSATPAPTVPAGPNDACLVCHGNQKLTMTLDVPLRS